MLTAGRPAAWLLCGVLVAGCRPGQTPADESSVPEREAAAVAGAPDREGLPPPMPPYPAVGAKRLAAAAAGAHAFTTEWTVRGGVCAEPPFLQLLGDDFGLGMLLVVRARDLRRLTGTYPVAPDTSFPEQSARASVRIATGRSAFAFRAVEGEVEVAEEDRRVSGRFALRLREIGMETDLAVAGAFRDVPLDFLPERECAMAREAWLAADSAAGR